MSADEVISYVFSWHALTDACKKCRSLHMKEYLDQNLFQNTLFDHVWGDIWDLDADHSLAHPNCRCQLTVRVVVELQKMKEWATFEELTEAVKQL